MAKEKIVGVNDAPVDESALDAIRKEQIDKTLTDEKSLRRAELNFLCEFLGLQKAMTKALDDLSTTVTIAGKDKICEFFAGVKENTEKEIVRQNVRKKISQSHKKPCKKNISVVK